MDFLEKVEKLPETVRDFLTSNESRFESEKSFFLYGTDVSSLKNVSKEIGMIFIGDERLINLPNIISKNINQDQGIAYGLSYEINKRIFSKFPDYFRDSQALLTQWEKMKSNPVISEEEAQRKLIELEPWILDEEKERIEKNKKQQEIAKNKFESLDSISIQKAISTYPRIGEQLLTSGMIKLKIFPQPARPSIKNWIEDYRTVMGAERHGMMERGNYLFHTENTKKLTSGERKKLAEVLRSLDEDVTLKVDPDRQEVVFEQTEEMKPVEKMERIANFSPKERPITDGQNYQPKPYQPPVETVKKPDFSQSEKSPVSNNQSVAFNPQPTNYNLQPKNLNFSSPHTFPSEKRNESSTPLTHTPMKVPDNKEKIQPIVRRQPSFDSNAGKPWEPASLNRGEPKVSGNTVDLRN